MEASKFSVIFNYRKRIAGALALTLGLKNGLHHLIPSGLFVPFNASLECSKYPIDHQIWLVRNVKRDLGIQSDILPFVTTSPNVLCAGILALAKWKSYPVVGIPKNFFCTNIFEVEDLNIKVHGNKNLDSARSPNEKALLESLIFSEAAQKFAVARQLIFLKDNWPIWNSLLSPFFVFLGYIACFFGPKILFSKGRHVSLTHILQWQIFCIITTWLFCKLTQAALQYLLVSSTDQKAAKISKQYAMGGIEYYENIRKCNRAWRVLCGSKGERQFTTSGNEKDGIIMNWKGPSFTDRENRLKIILKNYDGVQ
ncbi:transmembrane protein 177-like [Clavelina lepadiformis]|uniref:Transmembrane protein 177 n=1 Tax=Clavelina lepadiformis TaxID=159417 RepID=A0ABP0FFU8_CLALP